MIDQIITRRNRDKESVARFQRISSTLLEILHGKTVNQIATIMAKTVEDLWNFALQTGLLAVKKGAKDLDEKDAWVFQSNELENALSMKPSFFSAIITTSEKLKTKYTGGVFKYFSDPKTLRKYREELSGLGLYKWRKVQAGEGAIYDPERGKPMSDPCLYYEFDLIANLQVFRICHDTLLGFGKSMGMENPLDVFPSHRMYFGKWLHDHVLGGIQKVNRLEPDSGWKVTVPEVVAKALETTFDRLQPLIERAAKCFEFGWLRQTTLEPLPKSVEQPVTEDSEVKKGNFLTAYKDATRATPKVFPKPVPHVNNETKESVAGVFHLIASAVLDPSGAILPAFPTLEEGREAVKQEIQQINGMMQNLSLKNSGESNDQCFLLKYEKDDICVYKPCSDAIWALAVEAGLTDNWEIVEKHSYEPAS